MKRAGLLAAASMLVLLACTESASGPVTPIRADELVGRIRSGAAPLVLDVRSAAEFERGHIPGAMNIPHDQLPDRLGELQAATVDEVVVHCQSGKRAGLAQETLRANGYTNLRDLSGHWQAWTAAGLPTD